MITVKLLGGAKKSLSTDKLEFDKDDSTVSELLDFLQKHVAKNMPPLEVKNILVAVNGIDSSSIQGFATKLKDGDIVSIIPVIHGGSSCRIQYEIFGSRVELMEMKFMNDPIYFLDNLREKYPHLMIQGIRSRYILNLEHAKKIIAISLGSQKSSILLSKRIETDMLMRFACSRQINEAIQKVGLHKKEDFVLIAVGTKPKLDKLFDELKTCLKPAFLSNNNSIFLKKEFEISSKQLEAVLSKTPLEDLLAEKAAVLFR